MAASLIAEHPRLVDHTLRPVVHGQEELQTAVRIDRLRLLLPDQLALVVEGDRLGL
jgi:hypothetical protein